MRHVQAFNEVFRQALQKTNLLQPEDDQPISEIELWRQRSAIMGTLYENMFSTEFKFVLQVLEDVRSDTVVEFNLLRQ